MSDLAIMGGKPVRDVTEKPWHRWPVWDKNEERALLEVLNSGVWSYNGDKERAFDKAFADYLGVNYVVCAANGTVTLQLALEALGIGYGDEVILPGLTWQATAATIADVNAVPVLVDVLEDTWCIDPQKIEEAVTERTRAIIPVHLYGSFADMDAVKALARKYNLRIIEDCAHKHGGEWQGKKAGSLGDIGSFSFQLSKHLTAGEGGALSTSDKNLAEKLDALRNCGRRPEGDAFRDVDKGAGVYGDEGNFIQSGNYRLTEFQAAILLEGLKRLPEQNKVRDKNAQYLNSLLEKMPGVKPMHRDKRQTNEAYFNFSFRYFMEKFKNLPVQRFRDALSKELGMDTEPCYEPLNQCALYVPHTKPARHKLNEKYWDEINPARFQLPIAERIYHQESVCLHHKILMGPQKDMDQIAEAIDKIYNHAEELM